MLITSRIDDFGVQSGFPVAQHSHFCNLLRWYDHIHAVADSANLFPAPKFQKAKFVAPPPPAPPAAKPAATNGKAAAAAAQSAEVNSAPAAATPAAEGKKSKKEKKGEEPATPATSTAPAPTSAKAAPAAADTAASGPAVDVLDLRVGLITKVGPHPNADSLYVEEIDLGEEAPRQVVSGLRNFVPEEGMLNRRVVVVCNLKPAKMRDVMSYGMVLCASNADHTSVDPIVPPEGVPVGERITFEGYNGEPEAQLNPKKKIFEKIAPDLITDAGESKHISNAWEVPSVSIFIQSVLCTALPEGREWGRRVREHGWRWPTAAGDAKKFHAKSDGVAAGVDKQFFKHQDLF